ncbi:hypothetical protein HNR33_001073 [Brassicibacter mesophilus]
MPVFLVPLNIFMMYIEYIYIYNIMIDMTYLENQNVNCEVRNA